MTRVLVVDDGRVGQSVVAAMIARLESDGLKVEMLSNTVEFEPIAINAVCPEYSIFRRERDYPTLKQGLRMPKIRRGK